MLTLLRNEEQDNFMEQNVANLETARNLFLKKTKSKVSPATSCHIIIVPINVHCTD